MGLDISALLSFDLLRGPLNLAFALLNTYMLDLKVAQPSLEVLEREKESPHRDDGTVIPGLSETDTETAMHVYAYECIIVLKYNKWTHHLIKISYSIVGLSSLIISTA